MTCIRMEAVHQVDNTISKPGKAVGLNGCGRAGSGRTERGQKSGDGAEKGE